MQYVYFQIWKAWQHYALHHAELYIVGRLLVCLLWMVHAPPAGGLSLVVSQRVPDLCVPCRSAIRLIVV